MKMINVNGIWYPADTVANISVDTQNTFTPKCPTELAVNGGHLIVPEIIGQAGLAYYWIVTCDSHPAKAKYFANIKHPQYEAILNEEDMDRRWNPHGIPGTFGFELIEGLPDIKKGHTFVVFKGVHPRMHPYGICYHGLDNELSTGLIEYLDYEATVRNKAMKTYAIINGKKTPYPKKRVQAVIVGGLATDYCVKESVLQLLDVGFPVIVNLGACRGIAENTTQAAIAEMKEKGAVIVDSYQDIETKEAT